MRRLALLPMVFFAVAQMNSQDIHSKYEGLVNPLTGDFNWSENLLSLSNRNGQSIDISVSYSGNIKTNQPASWVGLGWNLNVGEIRRELIGFPDDKSNYLQVEKTVKTGASTTTENAYGFGPMHFTSYNGSNADHTMDIVFTKFHESGLSAMTPAFDQFHINSPFLGGTFSLNADRTPDGNELRFKEWQQTEGQTTYTYKTADANDVENISNLNEFQLSGDPLMLNYIFYHTNNDITTSTTSGPFMDYVDENGTTFSRSSLSGEDIGAFTIVTTNGIKLHYSLPVYNSNVKNFYFEIDQSGNILPNNEIEILEKTAPYVASWKLTAITGPDYQDLNNNNKPDDGDLGLWVRYYYAKWMERVETTPYFDLTSGVKMMRNEPRDDAEYPFTGSASQLTTEQYYIDKIETNHQQIIFYKDVRNDEFGENSSLSSTKKIPSLYLKRVVKYDKDASLSITKDNNITGVGLDFVDLNSASFTPYRNATYLESDYNETAQKDHILGAVVLNYNYSLCRKYYNHIDNISGLTPTSITSNPNADHLNQKPLITGTNGKLTLISIDPKGRKATNVYDDYSFTYNSNNPDYHHDYFDHEGYYLSLDSRRKLRYRSNLTGSVNINWALEKIEFPNKTAIEIGYENDVPDYRISNTANSYEAIVPIKSIKVTNTYINGTADLEVELYNDSDKDFISSLANRKVNFVASFKACSGKADIVNASGGLQYNGSGVASTSHTLSILSTSTANKVTLNCELSNVPTPCSFITTTDELRKAYFHIEDRTYENGGSRVKQIEIYDKDVPNDKYKLSFEYNKGYFFGASGDVIINNASVGQLNFGNDNTPINTPVRTVLYDKFGVYKYDLNGDLFNHSDRYHHVSPKLSFRASTVGNNDNECGINLDLLYKVSVRQYWKKMNEDGEESIPELIACAVNTYIYDDLKPGLGLTNPTWEDLLLYIPYYKSLSDLGYVVEDGSKILVKCTKKAGVVCGTKYVEENGTLNYPNDYFTIDHGSGLYLISHIINIDDQSNLLGMVDRIETFDKNGNLILKTAFTYDKWVKGYAEFTSTFGRSNRISSFPNNNDPVTRLSTKVNRYHYHPRLKETWTNGIYSTEEIMSLDARTGMPNKVRYTDPTAGITLKELDYAYDHSDHCEFWPHSPYNIELTTGNEFTFDIGKIESYSCSSSDFANMVNLLLEEDIKLYPIDVNSLNKELGIAIGHSENKTIWRGRASFKYEYNSGSQSYSATSYQHSTPIDPPAKASLKYSDSKLVSETELQMIDRHNNKLQLTEKITGNTASSRYDLNGTYMLASVEDCNFASFSCTGFEDKDGTNPYFEGEFYGASLRYAPTVNDIGSAHTGDFVARISNSSDAVYFTTNTEHNYDGLLTGRNYVASVWVNNSSYTGTPQLKVEVDGTIDGGSSSYYRSYTKNIADGSNLVVGEWTLIEIVFELPENYRSVNPNQPPAGQASDEVKITLRNATGTCYFDDLRFHPADLSLEVNVHDRKTGLLRAKLNDMNLFEKYEYDDAYRITKVTTESPHGVYTSIENSYND